MAIAMSGGLSGIIVYEAGTNGNWHDLLSRMADDNLAQQLSCSWYVTNGAPPDPVSEGLFEQMAAQGQSMFVASGDSDAMPQSTNFDYPEGSPHATVVGGTVLTTSGAPGSYMSESVWNLNVPCLSGCLPK